jgi:hypothetical protein
MRILLRNRRAINDFLEGLLFGEQMEGNPSVYGRGLKSSIGLCNFGAQ